MYAYRVKPSGVIKDGGLNYTINGDDIAINGFIKVSSLFMHKTYPINIKYHGQPNQWKTALYTKVGDAQHTGNLYTRVVDSNTLNHTAHIEIKDADYSLTGLVAIDTRQELVTILGAHLTAHVSGIGIDLQIEQVPLSLEVA